MKKEITEVVLNSFFDKEILASVPELNTLLEAVRTNDKDQVNKAMAELEYKYMNSPTIFRIVLLAKRILKITE